MIIYSSLQLEDMGLAAIAAFDKFYYGENDDPDRVFPRATPIIPFAQEFLGLSIRYTSICSDKSICGLTAYSDTSVQLWDSGVKKDLLIKRNEILIDSHLRSFDRTTQSRCRFTIAHECAHQLLYHISTDDAMDKCDIQYAARSNYPTREAKSKEDWNEWQANYLAAVILMPQKEIRLAMNKFARNRTLISYDGRFNYSDNLIITIISSVLCVSKDAARIRLEQLGYVKQKPFSQFSDPLEIYYEK